VPVSSPEINAAVVEGVQEPPSIPLYLSGMIVALCGIQAVNLTIEDGTFTAVSIALTVLGFIFSYGARLINLRLPAIQFICLVVVSWVLINSTGGQLSFSVLMRAGEDRNSTVMALLLASAGVLWSWFLFTDNLVAFSCVLSLAMLGLVGSSNINEPIVVDFCILIFFAIFLIIHQNYLQTRGLAAESERSRPMSSTIRMQFLVALISAALVLTLATIVIVPAQVVFQKMSLAQAIRRIASLGSGGHGPAGNTPVSFSDDDSLSVGTGDGWDNSTDVVMHITTSDSKPHYWRGRSYDEYNGDGWRSSLSDDSNQVNEDDTDTDRNFTIPPSSFDPRDSQTQGTSTVDATVDVRGSTSQFYYTGQPLLLMISLKQEGDPSYIDDGLLSLNNGEHVDFTYTIRCKATPDSLDAYSANLLRNAGTKYPANVQHHYMGPIENVLTQDSDRAYFSRAVQEATARLPKNRRDPYDIAESIREWVAARCIYSLSVPPIDPNIDHVHAFLATTRVGYCDMFASSMAVLCRTAGLPVRLATGFAPGESTDTNGFDIHGNDKHAWVEVYFPHYGWVEFDPTIGTREDSTIPRTDTASHFSLAFLLHSLPTKPLPILIIIAFLGLTGYLVKTELIDRYFGRWTFKAKVTGLADSERHQAAEDRILAHQRYEAVVDGISILTRPRSVQETPSEYYKSVLPAMVDLSATEDVQLEIALFDRLTQGFVRSRYGHQPSLTAEISNIDQQIAQFNRRARILQISRFLKRMFNAK